MMDPTYERAAIDAKPEWKLAFIISEIENDRAPLGWSKYIPLAKSLLAHYDMKPKEEGAAARRIANKEARTERLEENTDRE